MSATDEAAAWDRARAALPGDPTLEPGHHERVSAGEDQWHRSHEPSELTRWNR